ncbi:small G protein signaling modulator 3 homolog [Oppia nitens]|uniref:small G protein signaling modulator 3 homolog n=1 Tax=Oppia nitens TaxID=1686743 RepID=UPI0023D9AC84|nr:small G protein signaling modulator 3 homolog [Oppia nitens]
MAKSLVKSISSTLKSSPHDEGYDNKVIQPDTVSDAEDENNDQNNPYINDSTIITQLVLNSSIGSHYKPQMGGPFSSLHPSIWPEDIIAALSQPEDSQPPHHFNEYGFITESIDKLRHHNENQLQDLDEDKFASICKHKEDELRSKWICYLEFNYNKEAIPQMKWSQVDIQMKHTKVITELIKEGICSSLRSAIWMRTSKGMTLKVNSNWSYTQLCDLSNHVPSLSDKQISKVLPTNACFMTSNSVGIERLRRILRVIKWLKKNGTTVYNMSRESVNLSIIAAYLLLVCEEEDAFWLTLSIINELKSFSHQKTLISLISTHCPQIDEILKQHDIEISLITNHWFSTLFAAFIPDTKTLFHLWDLYFYFGSIVIFQLTLGLLVSQNNIICDNKDSANIFNALSDLPSHLKDYSSLLSIWSSGEQLVQHLPSNQIQSNAMSESSSNNSSLLQLPSFNSETSDSDLKTKNIRQTSIILELHEAIEAIGRHFEVHEPGFKANLTIDYSNIDIIDDEDEEINKRRQQMKLKRAKALIDFQRHDSDELGFRKNDIITIISERDEHCWVGELNGLRGWFPAKFVEILDERNQDYSIAGDDRVIPFINDLVRGRLYLALKAILTYGMKRTLFMTTHPWIIIESISKACAESDFNSVYSRLVLTRTYHLDEFARVLTPSELLYRSIAHINHTHENEAMDVKLRSLVCIALNQSILHEWFVVICANQPHIISKWYYNWSFLSSPVWKMIKSELKLLTQFSFNLDPNVELPESIQPKSPVSKDGVRDMLVKHHLFSWDI